MGLVEGKSNVSILFGYFLPTDSTEHALFGTRDSGSDNSNGTWFNLPIPRMFFSVFHMVVEYIPGQVVPPLSFTVNPRQTDTLG